jgi:hypothetical protein
MNVNQQFVNLWFNNCTQLASRMGITRRLQKHCHTLLSMVSRNFHYRWNSMLILDVHEQHKHMGYLNITLFLHRVSLSSEVPPTNGFYGEAIADIIIS